MDDDILKEILSTLDDIRAILLVANSVNIQEAKNKVVKEGSEQEKILRLCDGKTTEEIAKVLQKNPDYIHSNLSRLRNKGLVKTVVRNGKKVNEQRF